jgi:hypothetical protein
VRQENGRSDAALRRGLRLGQIRREFAPTLPYVREQPSPVRLTRHEQVRNSLAVCDPSKVMDARAAVGQSHRREALAEGPALSRKRAQNSVLALGRLISFGFRKKRHQADSSDAPLTSNPTTTISTTAGRAFISPSRSSVHRLRHATIFPSVETVHHTSARMRFMRAPIAHCCIGKRRPNRRALVANGAHGQRRG